MLTSHALTVLAAMGAYYLLDHAEREGNQLSVRCLVAAGACAALPAALEYIAAVVALPLGLFALWLTRPRRRFLFFLAGAAVVAAVPFVHHALVYGNPLHVGYASSVTPAFAMAHGRGFMGFDGFSIARLYEITLGQSRGAFWLSPFLLAAIPGWVRLLRRPETRAVGLVTAGVAGPVMVLVACFVHWHSGSAVGSRHTLLAVAFAVVPIAAVLRDYRVWIFVGMAVGFGFMVMATAVTAIPPTPPDQGGGYNVIAWLWERFAAGELATWQQAVLVQRGVGGGNPTLSYAFNLGQLVGLQGWASLVPYGIWMLGLGILLCRAVRSATACESPPIPV